MSKKKQNAPDTVQEDVEIKEETATEETVKETSAKKSDEKSEKKSSKKGSDKEKAPSSKEYQEAVKKAEDLQKKVDETINLLQRNQAEFDNFRKRNASVRMDSLEEGKRDCIKALLPILDNFDRAMETDSSDQSWRDGIALVQKQLIETLEKNGLSVIETDGKFDPNIHEAVMQESVDGKETGDIIAVFQKGYRVGDKVIRPSMVKVAQ